MSTNDLPPSAPAPSPFPESLGQDPPLQQVLESLGDGVWDLNLVSGRAYFSPRLKAIYGLSEVDDLVRVTDLDLLTHPDDLVRMNAARRAHWAGETPTYRSEHRVRHRDGHWVWVLTRGLVISRDAQGQPLRMVGTHTDITDRMEAELALRHTRERLELATHGSNDGLWDWDLVTDKVYYSPRFQGLLGYADPDEFERVFSFRSHLHPDDTGRVTQAIRDQVAGRTGVFDMEYRLRTRMGDYRWFHGRGRASVTAGADRPTRFAGHLTDITERVQAQAARQALEAQLRDSQKMEAMGTLAGGLAQDFNNLISVMLGNLALARRELAPTHPALASLAEVTQAAERAHDLVQQILAFSRRQAQHMKVLDLCQLVTGLRPQMDAMRPEGVTLVCPVPALPLPVLADSGQLQQVVMNLYSNACQALSGTHGEVRMLLSPASDGGVVLVVQDTGPGMVPEVLARVFEPFFSTRPFGGAGSAGGGGGLGLSVVHGIVKAHQGRIGVQSAPGQGSRFEVWLPAVAPVPPARSAQRPVPPPPPLAWVAGAAVETGARPPRHVVYVDDYEAMVYLVTRMLQKRGIRVSAFEKATDAMALIQANPAAVDLLVTDYNMPGFSGLDVVRQVKQWRPDLPMVITSGHVTPAMRAEALAEGVLEVLSKQDSVEDLASRLAELLASACSPAAG